MSDPEYLDSDDLVSWLLLNPESANEDIAVNNVESSGYDWLLSNNQATSSSSSLSQAAKPSKKRPLSRVSSSASMASNISNGSDDDDDDDNSSVKPAKLDTNRKKLMKMAELESKIKRITKGKHALL